MSSICPICRRAFAVDPVQQRRQRFCSERCQTIDLGNWLSGNYRVGAPPGEDEDWDEGQPPSHASDTDPSSN